MTKVVLLVCLMLFNVAYASDYIEIGYKSYVDLSSYKKDGNYASAWFKDLNRGEELIEGKKVWFHQLLYKANCSNNTLNLLYGVTYDTKGKVLRSSGYYPDTYSYYDPVVPDTVAETKYKYLCN